jgi:hypothetical protein
VGRRTRALSILPALAPASFGACQSMIQHGLDAMLAITPQELDGAATREVVFETPKGPLVFSGGAYLMSFRTSTSTPASPMQCCATANCLSARTTFSVAGRDALRPVQISVFRT